MASDYSGVDNLDIMETAKNYNSSIVTLIEKYLFTEGREAKVLDFGAGSGLFAKLLTDHNTKVVAVEQDSYLLDVLKLKSIAAYKSIDDVPAEGFEYAYSLNVLEHIKDDQKAIDQIYYRLNKGGKIFVYVPAFMLLYSTMDEKVGHYRRYTKQSLQDLFPNDKWKIHKSGYCDVLGFLVSLVYRFIGNKSGNIDKKSLFIFDRFIFPINKLLDPFFSGLLGKNVYLVASKL